MKVASEEIYQYIKNNPGISVAGLARAFPLSRISVQEKVNRFVAAGIVKKGPRVGKGVSLTATDKPLHPSRRERVMLGKRAWTKEEDFLLECMAESMPIELVVQQWPGNLPKRKRKDGELHWPRRSMSAIQNRGQVIGLSFRPVSGLMSMKEMSRQIGINHSVIASWVESGKLKAIIYPSKKNPKRRRIFLSFGSLVDYFKKHPQSLEYYTSKGVLCLEQLEELAADETK